MKTIIKVTIITGILALAACKKDNVNPENPTDSNPQEMITTVVLNGFNHDNPTDTKHQFSFNWEDLDGAGGNAPTIDTLTLDTGITYHIHVLVLDKSKTPYDTISNEIYEERNVHQFFYTLSNELSGKVRTEVLDFDSNTPSLPVGLEFHLNTQSNQSYSLPLVGSLGVKLSHYDGVPKTTAPSAESDLDITFPVKLVKF